MILSKKQMNHYTSEGYKMKKHNRLKKIIEKAECNCKLQKFLTEQALKIYISLTDIDKKYLFGEESCYGG